MKRRPNVKSLWPILSNPSKGYSKNRELRLIFSAGQSPSIPYGIRCEKNPFLLKKSMIYLPSVSSSTRSTKRKRPNVGKCTPSSQISTVPIPIGFVTGFPLPKQTVTNHYILRSWAREDNG